MPTALHSAFMEDLVLASRKLRTLFDAHARRQGLTLARARVLLLLARNDGQLQSQLSESLQVEQPSMVSLVDGLEKSGLVKRCSVEGDRRAKQIFLTDMARKEADGLLAFVAELREQVLDGLTDAELATASRVLQHVARRIETLG